MKTCKDCFYFADCAVTQKVAAAITNSSCFKDKSRFIELPCVIGDYCIWHDDLWYVNNITYCCDGSFLLWMSMADKSPCGAEAAASEVKFISEEEAKRMLEELNDSIL